MRDGSKRAAAVEKILALARTLELSAEAPIESPILGPAGNVEYLVHLRLER